MPPAAGPFSVPDPDADAWDEMIRQNRLEQAPNDSLRGDQDGRPDDVGAGDGDDSLAGGAGDDTLQPAAFDPKRAAALGRGGHYFAELIPRAEGTSSYDATYRDGAGKGAYMPPGSKKLTQMTVDEVISLAPELRRRAGAAVFGLYQFSPGALGEAKRQMNLTGSELYDGAMQDRILRQRLHNRGYDNYLAYEEKDAATHPELNKIADDFQKGLASEWPSLGGAPGRAQWDGVRVRQPAISAELVRRTMEQAKQEASDETSRYLDDGRMPPDWREASPARGPR